MSDNAKNVERGIDFLASDWSAGSPNSSVQPMAGQYSQRVRPLQGRGMDRINVMTSLTRRCRGGASIVLRWGEYLGRFFFKEFEHQSSNVSLNFLNVSNAEPAPHLIPKRTARARIINSISEICTYWKRPKPSKTNEKFRHSAESLDPSAKSRT